MIAYLQNIIDQAEAQAPYGQNPSLWMPPQALGFWCNNKVQRAVQALPVQRRISWAPGSLRADQIVSGRQSYINALLIYTRGLVSAPCGMRCHTVHSNRPFSQCVRLPGYWASYCPVRDAINSGTRQDLPGIQAQIEENAAPNARVIAIEDAPGDTEEDPIDLDPEDGSQENPYELD
ncbi:hypothetical protein ZTR_09129 [Talaromyces verruculosus]|nr:hypothetical protein ZTR_09129 [Talaromyces verruculosus]